MASERIALFPLSQALFPDSLITLTVFEVRYLHLIRRAQQEGITFGVVPLAEGEEVQKAGVIERLHRWGCIADVLDVQTIQPAVLGVRLRGAQRFLLGDHFREAYGLWHGEITRLAPDPPQPVPEDLAPLSERLDSLLRGAIDEGLEDKLPVSPPYRLDEAGWVADRWAHLLSIPAHEKAALLSEQDAVTRLRRIATWLKLNSH
jgi:Lon protease-like protein